MKMKLFLLPLILPMMFLTGCGGDDTTSIVKKMSTGEKVEVNEDNIEKYLNVLLTYKLKEDDEGSITKMTFTLSTEGYSSLSYFVSTIDCEIGYTYLGDDGEMTKATYSIAVNPGKDGKSSKKEDYNCNYRSVSDVSLNKCQCSGFVVKK